MARDQRGTEGGLGGGQTQQVGRHPHLAIAVFPGTDADHGNLECLTDSAGQAGWDVFQHKGEAARCLQLQGLAEQLVLTEGVLGLPTEAETMHRLGGEAEVAHHRDAHAHQPVDHRHNLGFGPLQLHRSGSGVFEQQACGGHRPVFAALVTQERQIADHQGLGLQRAA